MAVLQHAIHVGLRVESDEAKVARRRRDGGRADEVALPAPRGEVVLEVGLGRVARQAADEDLVAVVRIAFRQHWLDVGLQRE